MGKSDKKNQSGAAARKRASRHQSKVAGSDGSGGAKTDHEPAPGANSLRGGLFIVGNGVRVLQIKCAER